MLTNVISNSSNLFLQREIVLSYSTKANPCKT